MSMRLEMALALHKSAPRANLQPQFFPESLATLQTLEELFQNTHHNGIDADAFFFGPFLEREPRL